MTSTPGEVPLFEAPDLSALKRNWPRIALRAAAALVIPTLVTWLARSLDLYGPVESLPLPLDFLRYGPFAYGAKVVWTLAATFLVLAYLIPKRTPQLVMGVCVAAIFWTGYLFTRLQWTRLFSDFAFLQWERPPVLAWAFGALTLVAGAAFLLGEGILETRLAQRERGIPREETDELLDVTRDAALRAAGGAAAGALALGLAYWLVRATLADARLPVRVDPVLALLLMGIGLAVLVALALRPRAAVAGAPPLRTMARPLPEATAAAQAQAAAPSFGARWRTLASTERLLLGACVVAALSIALPWQRTVYYGGSSYEDWGITMPAGWALLGTAAGSSMAVLSGSPRVRRFAPAVFWALTGLLVGATFLSAVRPEAIGGTTQPLLGMLVGTAAAMAGVGLSFWGLRRGE